MSESSPPGEPLRDPAADLSFLLEAKASFLEPLRKPAPAPSAHEGRKHGRDFELHGRRQSLAAWADETGVKYEMLRARLRRGWSLVEAIRGYRGEAIEDISRYQARLLLSNICALLKVEPTRDALREALDRLFAIAKPEDGR